MIQVDLSGVSFDSQYLPDYQAAQKAHRLVKEKNGAGNDFLGWTELPQRMEETELKRIVAAGKKIRKDSEVLVVIGIGGSYLGARAAYDLLGRRNDGVELLFAGNGLSSVSLQDTVAKLGNRDFSINVVSKSGTTLEPALGFRIFKKLLIEKYGEEEANGRIYATTDAKKGALKSNAEANGWESFVVPDDVGGRYSVLSAVGLLPLAAAGIDVEKLIAEAKACFAELSKEDESNPCWQYAAARQALYKSGKLVEILGCYEPRFRMMAEWWKQLYGESEGKDGLGIFPASVEFNADLHSMGQYIQAGPRILMETIVSFAEEKAHYSLPLDETNPDGLDYLAGHDLTEVATIARKAVKQAHIDGGVPNIAIEVSDMNEKGFAELVCFFELSCAISGYMQGVNPFDQPGVEAYKKNMFAGLAQFK